MAVQHLFPWVYICQMRRISLLSTHRAWHHPPKLNYTLNGAKRLFVNSWLQINTYNGWRRNVHRAFQIVIGSYKPTVWMQWYAAQMCEGFFRDCESVFLCSDQIRFEVQPSTIYSPWKWWWTLMKVNLEWIIFRIIYLDSPSLALNQVVLKFTSQATLEMGVCKPKVCSWAFRLKYLWSFF